MCDQQDEASLQGLVKWKNELDERTYGSVPSVVLANKCDLRPPEAVRGAQDLAMEQLVQGVGAAAWTRTSALTGEGVEEGVRALVWHILDREAVACREEMARSDSIIQLPLHQDKEPPPRAQCHC